jgi:hypothetical protein
MRHEDAEPFNRPVDVVQYPDYLDVVEVPMDLGTIRARLLSPRAYYRSVDDFRRDLDLIFENSKAFNTDRRSRVSETCAVLSSY